MAESQQIPEPFNVHAWLVRPAKPRTTLTAIVVTPSSFVAAATTVSYALTFTLATTLPIDGKLLVEFGPEYEFGTVGATSATIDGGFTVTRSGQIVTVTRDGLGATDIGAVDLTITGVTNPVAGSYNIRITTQTTASVVIDGPGSSPNYSIGGLHTLSATLSNTTAREYSDYTFTFTAVTALPADGKIVLTFPWQTTFGPSPTATSTTIGGGFTVTTSENIATITRDGTGASETGVSDLKLTKVLNLSADTYSTQITLQNSAGTILSGPVKTTGYAVGTVADDTFTQKLKLDVMEGLWDWREDGGSSRAEFTLGQVLEDPATYINNEWEIILDVRVEPEREYTRWYRGNLVNVDTRSIGGKTVSVVQCNGAWATQATKARVEKDYTAGSSDVQALIKDVIQSGGIPNESTILYDATKIAAATYTPTTFDARGGAARVIETLAQLQGQTTYKVNPADRKIYTAAKTLTVQERNIYIIGKDAQEVHHGAGRNHLSNMFTLIGRNNSGKSPTIVRGDEEAVTEYGTRNKTVILPYLSATADLQRWADKQLEEAKVVRGYSVIKIPDVQKRVETDTGSTGNIRVWGSKVDQESDFVDLPLYKVQYRYGLACTRYDIPECTPEETRQPSRSIEATIWIGKPPPNIPELHEILELDKERITEWIEQGQTPDPYDGAPTTSNRPQDRTWDGQLTLDRTNEDLYLWDGTTEDYIRIGGKNVAFLDEAPTYTEDITISNATPSINFVDTTGGDNDFSLNLDGDLFKLNNVAAGRDDLTFNAAGDLSVNNNTIKISDQLGTLYQLGTAITATATELNTLDGVNATLTAAELNILDGVTATATELNYLDITTLGTGAANKAVVLDAGDDYTWPETGQLTYGGTAITATGAEINKLDGVTLTTAQINDAAIKGEANVFVGLQRITADGANSEARIDSASATSGHAGVIRLRKSGGTIAVPTAVATGEVMGAFGFSAHDGTNYLNGAQVRADVTTFTGTANIETNLQFSTRETGAAGPVENLRIVGTGDLGIRVGKRIYLDGVTAAGNDYITAASDGVLNIVEAGRVHTLPALAGALLGTANLGVTVQAYDATLASLAALGTAADKMPYTTGVDTWAETALTSFARTILDDATAAAVLTTLAAPGLSAANTFTANQKIEKSDPTFSLKNTDTTAKEWHIAVGDDSTTPAGGWFLVETGVVDRIAVDPLAQPVRFGTNGIMIGNLGVTPAVTGLHLYSESPTIRFQSPTAAFNTYDIAAGSSFYIKNITASPGRIDFKIDDAGAITLGDQGVTDECVITPGTGVAIANDISAAGGFKHTVSFAMQNVAASQTDQIVWVAGGSVQWGYPMPYVGSIMAISVGIAGTAQACTGGSLTVEAAVYNHITGVSTKTGLTAVISTTAGQTLTRTNTQAKGVDTFAAGNSVLCYVTTTGLWAPTAADIFVTITVEY